MDFLPPSYGRIWGMNIFMDYVRILSVLPKKIYVPKKTKNNRTRWAKMHRILIEKQVAAGWISIRSILMRLANSRATCDCTQRNQDRKVHYLLGRYLFDKDGNQGVKFDESQAPLWIFLYQCKCNIYVKKGHLESLLKNFAPPWGTPAVCKLVGNITETLWVLTFY